MISFIREYNAILYCKKQDKVHYFTFISGGKQQGTISAFAKSNPGNQRETKVETEIAFNCLTLSLALPLLSNSIVLYLLYSV